MPCPVLASICCRKLRCACSDGRHLCASSERLFYCRPKIATVTAVNNFADTGDVVAALRRHFDVPEAAGAAPHGLYQGTLPCQSHAVCQRLAPGRSRHSPDMTRLLPYSCV